MLDMGLISLVITYMFQYMIVMSECEYDESIHLDIGLVYLGISLASP